VRNHAEAVVKDKGVTDLRNMIGFNFRLPEIEAAIATAQLAKLEGLTQARIEGAEFLTGRWSAIPGLEPAWVQPGCRHVYYQLAVQYDETTLGVPRGRFVEAVRAEGVPLAEGYVEPLYLQPIYQQRAFHGGPNCHRYEGEVSYAPGICPTAESMYRTRLFTTTLFHPGLSPGDLEDVAAAVEKVATEARQLASA
jgi:perosamine synthetase